MHGLKLIHVSKTGPLLYSTGPWPLLFRQPQRVRICNLHDIVDNWLQDHDEKKTPKSLYDIVYTPGRMTGEKWAISERRPTHVYEHLSGALTCICILTQN